MILRLSYCYMSCGVEKVCECSVEGDNFRECWDMVKSFLCLDELIWLDVFDEVNLRFYEYEKGIFRRLM